MTSKVATLRVTSHTILADIDRLVELAGVSEALLRAGPGAHIRLGHEDGLGVGDPRKIEIEGDVDVAKENGHLRRQGSGAVRRRRFDLVRL